VASKKTGIVYISFGSAAALSAAESLLSIRRLGIDVPAISIGSTQVPDTTFIPWTGRDPWYNDRIEPKNRFRAGEIKPFLYNLSPFDYTLYLDADTMVYGDIMPGFELLERYDICIADHHNFNIEDIWRHPKYNLPEHAKKIEEREATHKLLGGVRTPFLNSGVIFFRKSKAAMNVFANWYIEWAHYREWDEQMALHRAIHNCPDIKIGHLPTAWNQKYKEESTIIWHKMGGRSARRQR